MHRRCARVDLPLMGSKCRSCRSFPLKTYSFECFRIFEKTVSNENHLLTTPSWCNLLHWKTIEFGKPWWKEKMVEICVLGVGALNFGISAKKGFWIIWLVFVPKTLCVWASFSNTPEQEEKKAGKYLKSRRHYMPLLLYPTPLRIYSLTRGIGPLKSHIE